MNLALRELRETGKAQATPDALRLFDEASFVRLRQPSLQGGFSGGFGAYELARVFVPKDAIGVVTLLWQYLATPMGPLLGPIVELDEVDVTWSLVVEDSQITGELRRVVDIMDPQPPSSRLPPYGGFSDLRHPWGSSERIKLFVNERTTLSLWVRVWAPGAEIRLAGGRLLGYTQSGQSAHAVGNLVVGF